MSCIQLDGSHTPVKRGGESFGYQGRKKCKTSNMLFMLDLTPKIYWHLIAFCPILLRKL